MGAVASIVAKSVFGHSDAENAFRPWWDTVQDHLIYGLITTGKLCIFRNIQLIFDTVKSLLEALLFAEHGEKILCPKIVLNVRNNFCTHHVLPRFEPGIFMY